MTADILIVEDDYSIQQLYKKLLLLFDFNVVGIAGNGNEAVSMYKSFSKKPDIILMDYRMPIKNGIEATKEILNINNMAKIIFMSADKTIKEEALSLGVAGFKEKPIKIKKLIDIINEVLSR